MEMVSRERVGNETGHQRRTLAMQPIAAKARLAGLFKPFLEALDQGRRNVHRELEAVVELAEIRILGDVIFVDDRVEPADLHVGPKYRPSQEAFSENIELARP